MARFRSLTHFPQQFFFEGQVYVLNPGEVKELPDGFIGRYGGLVELIQDEKKEEVLVEVPLEKEQVDEIQSVIDRANQERKDVLITRANSTPHLYNQSVESDTKKFLLNEGKPEESKKKSKKDSKKKE